MRRRDLLVGATAMMASLRTAHAEVAEVHIARQPGLGHLPLMMMEDQNLLQKHAAARGVPGLKVSYITLAGGAAMNDALLSNAIQFAAGGVPPLILLWSKTATTSFAVKGVAAMCSMPLLLNTTDPKIKTLRDFTDRDRIALPAVKVSVQAFFLQMGAEKELGASHRNDLDRLTVTLSHPDGMAAMLAGHEITAHFTAPPIQELELRHPGVHTVLNSFDVLGMPSTFDVVWASSKFVQSNPQIYAAFTAALDEAITSINGNKRAAAETYVRVERDTNDVDFIEGILHDPQMRFTTIPQAIQKFTDFMVRTNLVHRPSSDWKDIFFANTHNLPGN